MIARAARWGVSLLLLALLVAVGIGFAAVGAGPLPPPALLEIALPLTALLLGACALLAGHLSYPRVQNLKVYVAGYSLGIESILLSVLVGFATYFVDSIALVPAGYVELFYALALLGTILYTFVRSFPTYRVTRNVTVAVSCVLLALLVAARFFVVPFSWIEYLIVPQVVSLQTLAILLVAAGVIVANALQRPESFYLRGAISGLALLAASAWIAKPLLVALGLGPVSVVWIGLLYAGATPFFFLVAMLFHVLARMEHRASYDPLLHIYNREYCNRILSEQSSIVTRPPFSVLMIDIDHFKQVNDTYGHQAGDKILYSVAQTVQKSVVPEGILCRYGGEELIAFFPGLAGRDVVPLAQRIRQSVERLETKVKGVRISVTVSLGLSDRKVPKHRMTHVASAADKALYIAKENGRNQLRFVRIKL
ncbi:MAG: GGDEF domain-containing protein [Spirochaetota bacterium]